MKWELLKKFSVKNTNCFSYRDVLAEYPDKDRSYLSRVLAAMVNRGMLTKLSRDLYCIIPLNADPETYSPDSSIIAKGIMKGRVYYIAYYSAMYIHGLTDQAGKRTMIASTLQKQPSIRNINGNEFQFIYLNYDRFFGYRETWVNQQEQVLVSDLEKTIVDAVSKPQLCGGITEVGQAISRAIERIELSKLFYYLARNGSNAAKKRYLFLSDHLGLEWTADHERMKRDSGSSLSLLDPAGPEKGMKDSNFGLKINVELNTLKESLQT